MSAQTIQPERVTLTLSETEIRQARDLEALIEPHRDDFGQLVFDDPDHGEQIRVPRELTGLIQHLVTEIANGRVVQISSMPEELTTTVAARQLEISRTTLLKLIAAGEMPSHKVGTHARIKTADVLAFKRARLARQRAAFAELTALADELGEH